MPRLARWLLAAALLPVAANGSERAPASGGISSGVVKISVSTSAPDPLAPWQRQAPATVFGSGVVIAGRRILTNAHVIDHYAAVEVQRAGTAARYTARVEHVCDVCDLAILRVMDDAFFQGVAPLELGDLPALQEPIDVYGFPEGGSGLSITSGVVSRIEVGPYAYSKTQMLLIQVDAAINPGNSGGPAIVHGKIAGIAMQLLEDADNVGYVVPAPVIRHFLEDVEDGRYDGFPDLGIEVQTLENPALRRRLGLAGSSGGILVVGVSPKGSAAGRIDPGDIVLAVDGVAIQEDGSIEMGGLQLDSIVLDQRAQMGQDVVVTLLRRGARIQETVQMKSSGSMVDRGDRPRYRIFGGLVFQPLTTHYLEAFESIPAHLSDLVENPPMTHGALGRPAAPEDREEVVLLAGVLSNELTRGYEGFEHEVVYAVDGVPVRSLGHLSRLLDDGKGEFVNVVLERGGVLTIPRGLAAARAGEILAGYGVGSDRSPDLQIPADRTE